jgi:hypothetical protein
LTAQRAAENVEIRAPGIGWRAAHVKPAADTPVKVEVSRAMPGENEKPAQP